MEIRILGCSGVIGPMSCTVDLDGKELQYLPSLSPEIAKPSIKINSTKGTVRFSVSSSTISLSHTLELDVLGSSTKHWLRLYREPDMNINSQNNDDSVPKLLILVKKSIENQENRELRSIQNKLKLSKIENSKLESLLKQKTNEFVKAQEELEAETKMKTKLKQMVADEMNKPDEQFLKLADEQSMRKYITKLHPGCYLFKDKALSIFYTGNSLFCHFEGQVKSVKSFFEKQRAFHKKSKTIDDLNQLINNTVFSVTSKLPHT